MAPWTLTWYTVAPLFRDTWTGPQAAAQVLGHPDVFALLCRLSAQHYRTRRDCRARFSEPEDLALEVIELCLRRLAAREGMPRPPAWQERPTPQGTLVNYLRSRVQDACRPRRLEQAPMELLDAPASEGQMALAERLAGAEELEPGVRAERHETRRLLGATLQQAREALPAQQLLVWLCMNVPELVDEPMVQRAEDSLVRAPGPTWGLLGPWLQEVLDPLSRDGRRDLAWILRSAHPGPSHDWAEGAPVEAKTARDTLTKWASRARTGLRALATALGAAP